MPRIDVEPATPVASTFARQSTPPSVTSASREPPSPSASVGGPARSSASSARSHRHSPYPASPAGSSYSSRSRTTSEASFDDSESLASSRSRTTTEYSYSSSGSGDDANAIDSDYEPASGSAASKSARSSSAQSQTTPAFLSVDPHSVDPSQTVLKPKKSHARKTPPGHIKRPPNAFILFRSHCCTPQANPDGTLPPGTPTAQQLRELGITDHRHISRIVSHLWKALTPAAKAWWDEKAFEMKLEHARMYPEYKYKPINRAKNLRRERRKKVIIEEQAESERKGCEEIAQALMVSEEVFDPEGASVESSSLTTLPNRLVRPPPALEPASKPRSRPRKPAPPRPAAKMPPPPEYLTEANDGRQRWTIDAVAQSLVVGQAVLPAPPPINRPRSSPKQAKPPKQRKATKARRRPARKAATVPVPPSPEYDYEYDDDSNWADSPSVFYQSPSPAQSLRERQLPVVAGPPRLAPRSRFAGQTPSLELSPPDEQYSFPSRASAFVSRASTSAGASPYGDALSPTSTAFSSYDHYSPMSFSSPYASTEIDPMLVSPTADAFDGRRPSLGQWVRKTYTPLDSAALDYDGPLAFGDVFLHGLTRSQTQRRRQITGESDRARPTSAMSSTSTTTSIPTEVMSDDDDEDEYMSTSYPLSHTASSSDSSLSSWRGPQHHQHYFAQPHKGEAYHLSGESFFVHPQSAVHASHRAAYPTGLAEPLFGSPEFANSFDPSLTASLRRRSSLAPTSSLDGLLVSPDAHRCHSFGPFTLSHHALDSSASASHPDAEEGADSSFESPRLFQREQRGSEATIRAFRSPSITISSLCHPINTETGTGSDTPSSDFPVSPNLDDESAEAEERQENPDVEKRPKVICLSREQAKNKSLVDQISRSGYSIEIDNGHDGE